MLENEIIKAEVIKKYLEEGQDVKQLADEYYLSTATINNWGREYIENYQSLEEANLFRRLNATQLRYKLIKLYREKSNKEKYKLINRYDCISIMDSIVKSKEVEDYSNYFFHKNERNLSDIYYEVERGDNRILRIYVFNNYTFSEYLDIDGNKRKIELSPRLLMEAYFDNHPFPGFFDRDVFLKVYDLIHMASVVKGYIDFNIYEDLVDKLIPEDFEAVKNEIIQKKRDEIFRKVIASLDLLMSLNSIEYSNSESKEGSQDINKVLKEKFLFKEMKWINEKEGKIRIYLARILSEDWLKNRFKDMVYGLNGDYSVWAVRKTDNSIRYAIDSSKPEN